MPAFHAERLHFNTEYAKAQKIKLRTFGGAEKISSLVFDETFEFLTLVVNTMYPMILSEVHAKSTARRGTVLTTGRYAEEHDYVWERVNYLRCTMNAYGLQVIEETWPELLRINNIDELSLTTAHVPGSTLDALRQMVWDLVLRARHWIFDYIKVRPWMNSDMLEARLDEIWDNLKFHEAWDPNLEPEHRLEVGSTIGCARVARFVSTFQWYFADYLGIKEWEKMLPFAMIGPALKYLEQKPILSEFLIIKPDHFEAFKRVTLDDPNEVMSPLDNIFMVTVPLLAQVATRYHTNRQRR